MPLPSTAEGWRKSGAAALLIMLGGTPAHAAVFSGPSFSMEIDARVWQMQPFTPPLALRLKCRAPDCGPTTTLVVIDDPRGVSEPAASRFSRGAVGALAFSLRVQTIMPNRHVFALDGVSPIRLAGHRAYRARFQVEDRNLASSRLVAVAVPHGSATLHIHLLGQTLSQADERLFDALLATLVVTDD